MTQSWASSMWLPSGQVDHLIGLPYKTTGVHIHQAEIGQNWLTLFLIYFIDIIIIIIILPAINCSLYLADRGRTPGLWPVQSLALTSQELPPQPLSHKRVKQYHHFRLCTTLCPLHLAVKLIIVEFLSWFLQPTVPHMGYKARLFIKVVQFTIYGRLGAFPYVNIVSTHMLYKYQFSKLGLALRATPCYLIFCTNTYSFLFDDKLNNFCGKIKTIPCQGTLLGIYWIFYAKPLI